MKKKTLFVAFALIVIFTNTCKKEKDSGPKPVVCSETNTIKSPKDAVKKFYFKDSTYWVYQESVTHQLDSVWVEGSKSERFSKCQFTVLYKNCYEGLSYKLYYQSGIKVSVALYPNGCDEDKEYSDQFFLANFGIEANGKQGYYLFSLKGNTYLNTNADEDSLYILSNLKVLNTTYNNVVHLSNLLHTPDVYKEVWYSDSIGLIKYRRTNNSVWELLRCNIK